METTEKLICASQQKTKLEHTKPRLATRALLVFISVEFSRVAELKVGHEFAASFALDESSLNRTFHE